MSALTSRHTMTPGPRVLIRRDEGSGGFIVYLRREGPAGSIPLRLDPGFTAYTDVLKPAVPVLATVLPDQSGRIAEAPLHLIDLVFGAPARESLAASRTVDSVEFAPTPGSQHAALLHLLALSADLNAMNPLAAATAALLAIRVGHIDDFARDQAQRAACLLRCLPDEETLSPDDVQRTMLETVVNVCTDLLGPVDLGPLRVLRSNMSVWDLDLSEFDWNLRPVPLAGIASRVAEPIASASRRPTFRRDRSEQSVTERLPGAQYAIDVTSLDWSMQVLEGLYDGRSTSLKVQLRFERQPPQGQWLQVIEPDGVCSFESRILSKTFVNDRWVCDAVVFLGDSEGVGRPVIRLSAEPWVSSPSESEARTKAARSSGDTAAKLLGSARSSRTEAAWRSAAAALTECGGLWASVGDHYRQAVAVSMAASCFDLGGRPAEAEELRHQLEELTGSVDRRWLEEDWLDLDDPEEASRPGVSKVLGPLIRKWAAGYVAAQTGNHAEDVDDLVEGCLRFLAQPPLDPSAQQSRLQVILTVGVLCASVGRPLLAWALAEDWAIEGDDESALSELPERIRDLRRMLAKD